MSVNGVGKKVNLKPLQQSDSKDFKGGLRLDKFGEGISEKDKAIFNAIDKNNDGVVTQDELNEFFAKNEGNKGLDRNSNDVVTGREAKKFIKNNQTLSELQIDKKELLAFLNKAGQASENVKSCTLNDQGQVVVTYNDDSTDTISPDSSRINNSTNDVGEKVTTAFNPQGKKISEVVVGDVPGQSDECTTTTLYEVDGETVKNITITDSKQRIVSKTEGNTVTDIRYDDATGAVYESVTVNGKLSSTTVKDPANNKTTVIEYDTEVGEDGAQLQKTRTETIGDEVKTYKYENGVKSTLTIKKGTKTENYEYDESGTTAKHKYTDIDKGNGVIERQTFTEQNGKQVTTISIGGVNKSQSMFGADGKVARTIKYADAPNGERATVVVIQDQETITDICNKFGITQEEFKELNKGNANGLKGNVGAEVNVKGELEVTDARFNGRLSSKAAIKAKNNRIYNEQLAEAKSVANQRKETVMLISRDKNYGGSWENVARDLYQQEGNTKYSKMDLKVRANQLQKLNPNVKTFEYGRTVIRVAIDPAAAEMNDTVRKLSNGSDAILEWTMAKGGETHAWNIALRACQQTENDVARPLTPLQQGIRAKKIIELNPGVFDKTGKMINPPANGKLKVPAGYTKAYKKRQAEAKAKQDNQYYVAAEQVYKTAVNKNGMSAVSTIKKQLSTVTSDHIVQFYESYSSYLQAGKSGDAAAWGKKHGVDFTTKGAFGNKWIGGSDDSSIYDTICSETGMGTDAGKQQRKDLCNDVFNKIATAAKQSGVSQADINNARNRFTSSMNAEFNGSGTVNTTKMEQATDWLIGKIHEAKTGANPIDAKTAQDAFKQQYQQSVTGAQESFDKNMEHVTWVGKFTAWTANIFADNTTVGQMESKLGIAKGSLDKLNKCKTQAEFNSTYEQIFGVPFNAKNVATVMKLEKNLQTIAMNEAQVEGINKSFATVSRSNSLSDYENWVTAGINNSQDKASTLDAIYSQFGGVEDISKLSEAGKMNAIRKAKDAEIAAIKAETAKLRGGKTTEQIKEDISTLASASFGPNNNIAKEVEKFNGNINRSETVGTVVTEIGVTLIPVGRVLSFAGKGIRLANGAYKAYRASKTVATTAKTAKAVSTAAKTTQIAADAATAAETTTIAGKVTNKVKTVVSNATQNPITRQSVQAGFNSGALDYSKYGDAEHAVEHGLETAAMFEVGGRASQLSQKISSNLEITSTVGRWAVEAGVTGTADTAAAYAQTTIINGQDLSTEDGLMNFGLDATFAALGARGTRVKPQGAKSDGFNYGNTFKHQDAAGAVTGRSRTGEGAGTGNAGAGEVTGRSRTGETGASHGSLTGVKTVAKNKISKAIKKVQGFFSGIFGGSSDTVVTAVKVKRGKVQKVKSHIVPKETDVPVSRQSKIEDSAFEIENHGGKSILVKDSNGKSNVIQLGKGEKVVIGQDKHGNDLVAVRDADGDVKIHRTKDVASVETPKFQGISAEQKQNVQKALDDFAQKRRISELDKNNPTRRNYENITAKLELVDDPVIANAVKERFEALNNELIVPPLYLEEIENLLDAVNTFNGHYSTFQYNKGYSKDYSHMYEFNKYLSSVDLAKHQRHEIGTYNGAKVVTKLDSQNNTVIEYQGSNGPVKVVAKVNGNGLNVEYHNADGSVSVVPQKGRVIEIGDSGYRVNVLGDRKIEVRGAGNELDVSREGAMIDSHNLETAADGMSKSKVENVLKDLPEESRIDMLSQYIGAHKGSNMSGYLYERYYLKHLEKTGAVSQDVINSCRKIKEDYGSHVFLSASGNAQEALEVIDKEFSKWKKAGGSEVTYPPQINFSKIRRQWYNKYIGGESSAAAYSMPGLNRSLEFSNMTEQTVRYALRHEMTHSNDLRRFTVSNDVINDIMPKKTERRGGRNYEVPDMDKAKYVDEFRNAGIPEGHISYAYNNPHEFLAVASEGNLSKYSPEFRAVLESLGMPRWLFNLDEHVVDYDVASSVRKPASSASHQAASVSHSADVTSNEAIIGFPEKIKNMFGKKKTPQQVLDSVKFEDQYKTLSILKNSDGTPMFTDNELKQSLAYARSHNIPITSKDLFALATSGMNKNDILYTMRGIMSENDLAVIRMMTNVDGISLNGSDLVRTRSPYKFNAMNIQDVRMIVTDSPNPKATLQFVQDLIDNRFNDNMNLQIMQLHSHMANGSKINNDGHLLTYILRNFKTDEQRSKVITGLKSLSNDVDAV